MAAEKTPEWLPAGWSMEVRTRKTGTRAGGVDRYYTSPEIKRQFRSKNEIFRYLESRKFGKDVVESVKTSKGLNATNESLALDKLAIVEKSEDLPMWLPPGWTIEIRTRKGGLSAGMRYKCYIDPLSGCKFYSKAKVIDYIQAGPMGSKSRKRKRSINALSMENLCSDPANGCIYNSKNTPVQCAEGDELENYVSVPVSSVDYAFCLSLAKSKRSKTGGSNARRCLFANPLNLSDGIHSAEPLIVAPISYIPMKDNPSVKKSSESEEQKISVDNKLMSDGLNGEAKVFDDEKQTKNGASLGAENVIKIEDTALMELEDKIPKENADPVLRANKNSSDHSIALQLDEIKRLENKVQQVEKRNQKEEQVWPEQKDNQPPENRELRCKTETTRFTRRKTKARTTTDLPRRVSKRLAGMDPEVIPDSADPAHARRQAKLAKKTYFSLPRDFTASNPAPCGSEELNQLKSHVGENPTDEKAFGSRNNAETGSVTKSEPSKPVSEKPSSPVISPFGDSWPDPCLEFAFKTLTDAIPVDCLLQTDFFSADSTAQLKPLAESRRENMAKG
ncbi:uncharacterized protein [Aristolochia californica]|uniref:uncharacterized protein n=1 Tax=Aristolochia californica TaxID=171875 RepID=UPI0035D5A6FB